MTNADKIRAMSDNELAQWFCYRRACNTCPYGGAYNCTLIEWLHKETDERRDWLKQEVEE